MKKMTLIIALMSFSLMAWKFDKVKVEASQQKKELVATDNFHAIMDTVRTKPIKLKIVANPSAVAKVELLSVQSVDGEVLYQKYAADNVSTTVRFKVTPNTEKVLVKYGGKVTEVLLEEGAGVFDFMKT